MSCPFAITSLIRCEIKKAEMTHFLTSLVVCKHGPRVLASQAEAIVRTRKTWPQATKRRTGN